MSYAIRLFGLLLVLIAFYAAGTFMFTKGFLLKRAVLEKKSSCGGAGEERDGPAPRDGCWTRRRFRRAVVLLIDALRFDFMAYRNRTTKEAEGSPPYLNKLPAISERLTERPGNALLFRFLADPPTTTLQRLKGLTTGSLPTFVDMGSNFARAEITEDNIVDQLVRNGKKIVFLGDDTWTGLFPGRFFKSFPYPSFNVRDLHTVDDGILQHLIPEMSRAGWDVIIAHFLGVDHCGHRFGPNHVAMSDKLTQMNQMLRSVLKKMEDDTILFVMGDHGMTQSGDHGGDSEEELESGLFVYSPSQITSTAVSQNSYRTVHQTDFLPTISLLLGVPIPFSNIGMVISDLFSHSPRWTSRAGNLYQGVEALHLNAQQVSLYLQVYSQASEEFLHTRYHELLAKFKKAEQDFQNLTATINMAASEKNSEQQLEELRQFYESYLQEVRILCERSWARFDLSLIVLGIVTTFTAAAANLYFMSLRVGEDHNFLSKPVYLLLSAILLFVCFTFCYGFYITDSVATEALSIVSLLFNVTILLMIIYLFAKKKTVYALQSIPIVKQSKHKLLSCYVLLVSALYFSLFFSNSYVVFEDGIVLFFSQTMAWIYCVHLISTIFSEKQLFTKDVLSKRTRGLQKFDIIEVFTHPAIMTVLFTLVFNAALRLSSNFRACREEQLMCVPSGFLQPLSSLVDTSFEKNLRYFFSVTCLAIMTVFTRHWLRHYGNLNGNSLPVLSARFGFPFTTISIALHWAVQGLPANILDNLPPWQQTFLAKTAYILLLVSVLALLINPLCVYVVHRHDEHLPQPISAGLGAEIIPQVFHLLQTSWKKATMKNNAEKLPLAYGLGTVFSASSIYYLTFISLLLMLVLGDGTSPSILLAGFTIFIFLEIHSSFIQATDFSVNFQVSWPAVAMWCLLSYSFFYGTGHQTTIPAIKWEAAFTGFHGDFDSNVIPAVLITLHTFSSHILFTAAAPLLLFWPYIGRPATEYFVNQKKRERSGQVKGDFFMFENKTAFKEVLFQLYASIFFFNVLLLQGTMCAAAVQRRHLMVWKIFSPRFMFQGVSVLVVFVTSLLSYLIMVRLVTVLTSWTSKLQ